MLRDKREQRSVDAEQEKKLDQELTVESGDRLSEDEPYMVAKREAQKSLIEKHKLQEPFSQKTINLSEQLLISREDALNIEFARQWFRNNKEKLIQEGRLAPENASDSYILQLAGECGAFDDLEENDAYQKQNEALEDLAVLKTALRDGAKTTDSRYLLLNFLNKEDKRLFLEEDAKSGLEKEAVSGQIEDLYQARKEVYRGLAGRNIEEVTISGVKKSLMPKEQYVEEAAKEAVAKFRAQTDPLYKKTMIRELLGLTMTEKKGLLGRREVELVDRDGKVLGKFGKDPAPFNAFIEQALAEKAKENSGFYWNRENSRLRLEAERELERYGNSPEKAIEGIRGVYGRVREAMEIDFVKNKLKKEPKTREQLLEIADAFKERGFALGKFVQSAIKEEGELRDIKGKWQEDKEPVLKYLGGWEIVPGKGEDQELLARIDLLVERNGLSYERKVKTKTGLVEWLIGLVFNIEKIKEEERKKKIQQKQGQGQKPAPVQASHQPKPRRPLRKTNLPPVKGS